MQSIYPPRRFLRSRTGAAFVNYLVACAIVSAALAFGFYQINFKLFQQNKGEEKLTALQLVDAFVGEYADLRTHSLGAEVPVPATFRAHAIDRFNQKADAEESLAIRWVGVPGREIATAPTDPAMAETIRQLAATPDPKPVTSFVETGAGLSLRTVYPSLAAQQSCVDCHNRLQAGREPWKLNDVMGAFALEVPASGFLRENLLTAIGIGLFLLVLCGGIGFYVSLLHYRHLAEREIAEQELERRVAERTADLQAAQAELIRKERFATLGQITATVSHELRNPLGVIRNTMFTIAEAVQGAGLHLDRPMQRIERSITRCDLIIAELLDYTRGTAIQREPVRIDALLADLLDEQTLPAEVRLIRELGASGVVVDIDPHRFRRAVINLVENAAQAIKEHVERTGDRTTQPLIVRSAVRAGSIEVLVEDAGPGIPADVFPKIFEPLFSTKGFGVGLGLPTVKQIIENHGGEVEIVSAPGKGTQARLSLPLTQPVEEAA